MSENNLYSQLQWLPRPPQNMAQLLKNLQEEDASGSEFQSLASYALDLNQLTRLARAMGKARLEDRSLSPLDPFRLAVLSNATMDMIIPALIASAARYGIALEVIHSAYGQVAQEAFTPGSTINTSNSDAVLIALDYRALPLKVTPGELNASTATVHGAMSYLQALRNAIKDNLNAVCVMQSFAPPEEQLFGSLDRVLPGTMRHLIDTINRELSAYIAGSGDVLLDVATLAETVGLAEWHSAPLWNLGKFAFNDEMIPLYADHVARTLAAIRGKSRKALILDLDNTLWGGVIGDDGLTGIKIAQGDARGEAHLALQRLALDLRKRGVILAVSSKNSDEIARSPFERHPEMLLKLEHFAVFQANWQDKATNIRAIAEELSLGLDAMVFLDDNPVERGLVRSVLPQVAVPELPEDPAWYSRTLAAAGYFEAVAFADEDRRRAGFYHDNARRAAHQKQIGGVDAYLASLEMTITFQPFDPTGRARIVQLINKSNQYNLTTRRYTEPEILEMENDPSIFTLQLRLADIFGDNGMISVVICRTVAGGVWDIDTWLMSCRVLGRKVEHVVLSEMIRHARLAEINKLTGAYIPTERNKLVVDHYAKLGFVKTAEERSGKTHWELCVNNAEFDNPPVTVVSRGFVPAPEGMIA